MEGLFSLLFYLIFEKPAAKWTKRVLIGSLYLRPRGLRTLTRFLRLTPTSPPREPLAPGRNSRNVSKRSKKKQGKGKTKPSFKFRISPLIPFLRCSLRSEVWLASRVQPDNSLSPWVWPGGLELVRQGEDTLF